VFEAIELPTGVSDLNASLADVDWDALSHCGERRRKIEKKRGKGFRDECLLRSLSGSLICVAMREVMWHGATLGFGVFMEAEDKQNPKTGDTKAVV